MYKSRYQTGITRQDSSEENQVIWIKLSKANFGLDNDLYIAAGYFPGPKGDVQNSEKIFTFSSIEEDIIKYKAKS